MISIQDFASVELKTAVIETVAPHPNADKLYVLNIKVGDKKKQIVAGIRPYYGEDELKGKTIVVVDNLEPAVIRGVESQGMLLAVSKKDQLAVLVPDRQMDDGVRVK